MSTNSTSTDTGVPTTSTQTPSSPTSTSVPPSSSIANSSSTPVSSSTPLTSSTLSSSILSTSSTPLSTSSSTTPPTTSTPTPSSTSTPLVSSTAIQTTVINQSTKTIFSTSTEAGQAPTNTGTSTSSSSSAASTTELQSQSKSSSSGLGTGGTIAVAVVVPIVVVALLVLAGIFFWRKRKARKDTEELRRKEVEEYGYNPNNDPTLPAVGVVGSSGGDGPYEMREDGSSGYRGWGTTAVASSGRKASTTLSGGQSAGGIGMAHSEGSPTHGPISDTRSDNPLVDGRPLSPEAEALGAMGPAASANRTGDINRGPSNASSSYSAANRSDGSGEAASPVGGQYYNNQYDTGNPYGPETQYGSPPGRAEMSGQPVIRDVQARRNTRIENPSHFPQQSAGISQNF